MIVFCSAEGTVTKVLPSPVYQGSSLSGGLYFVAPFPSSNTVTVAFQLANGDFTTDYLLSPITENDNELQGVFDKLGKNYSVWEWQADNGFVTAYAGEVTAQFKVVYAKNGVAQLQTTASVVFTVQKGVETLPAEPPSGKQWDDLLSLYTQLAADYTQLTADLKALGAPSVEPIAATVPLRDKNGNVKTNEPQADNDAANKKFVKDAIVQNIVQNAGSSTDKVMSQKAVSDELNKKSNATNLENGEGTGSIKMSLGNNSAIGAFAFATGYYTSADAGSSYAGGYYSKANVQFSIAYGISARTENDVLAAFGEYNNPTTGDVFEIGNGNSNSRSNAFAVRKDGRAKVQTAPKEDNDVVRLKELGGYYTTTESDGRYVKQSTSTGTVVYGRKAGAESTIEASYSVVANSIPYRDSYGTLQVNDPINILDAVNKRYGIENYFNQIRIVLTPTIGDTISKEQLQNLRTGLYWIANQYKLYDLAIDGWFNMQVFGGSSHTTFFVETAENAMYMAQILTDTDRTFTGWIQVATTSYVDSKAGGKLYRHDIVLTPNAVDQDLAALDVIYATIYSSSNEAINTVEKCLNAIGNSAVYVGLSSSQYDTTAGFGYIWDGYISWIYKYDTVFVKQVEISSNVISDVVDTVTEL